MVIDFTEIPSLDNHAFENFCMHLLQEMGLTITVYPAVGPDGGRDIICEEYSQFARSGLRWLVSCKHYAGSKKSIGVNEDAAIANKLTQHGCDAFMFFFSTPYTEGFRNSVENVCYQIRRQFKIFNCYDIEKQLLSSPKFYPLIRQYFPISHGRLVGFLNSSECCDRVMPQDALFVVYTWDNIGRVLYQVFGECCIGDFLEHLQENNIEYGFCQIRNNTFY